jgi:adenine deaminase
MADLLIIPSAEEFSPQLIICNGRIIYQDGKALVTPRKAAFPDSMFHTVTLPDPSFSPKPGKEKVRAIEMVTGLVTKEKIINLENPKESQDVIPLLALDRIGRQGSFTGFLKGFGLQRGAYGTTMTWDSIDMLIVGCDVQSMETVIQRLKETGGGGVYAIGDEVVSEMITPLWGVYSLKPMEILSDELQKLEGSLRENGVRWEKPTLAIDTLGTPAIPHLRITHEGYVRLRDRKVLPVEA